PKFDKQKFVHVTIDTFSGFLHTFLQSGEASKHCIAHYIKCFAVMGTPKTIKTDNGPGYTRKKI
ncbi:integrase catalytic domain-containing protein, partial [Klebsiella pneumoniae]